LDNFIIESFDVIPYLEDRRIEYLTEGPNVTEGWVEVKCPWCGDPSFHLGINLESNFMSCWRCPKKGSVIKYVREIENNCRYDEALAIIEKYQNFTKVHRETKQNQYVRQLKTPDTFVEVKRQSVTDFLHRRGFNPMEIYRDKVLYYGGITGLMKHRLILPITYQRKVVSFVGRALSDKMKPKYANWPDKDSIMPVKQTLYGYDDLPPGGNIVVVEGTMDQWKLGAGSVATYGTRWTMNQVNLLRETNPNKVYILFDSEEDAQDSAVKLSKQIWFCPSEVIMLDKVKDPGELTKVEAKEVMRELL
jgi:DNA primase